MRKTTPNSQKRQGTLTTKKMIIITLLLLVGTLTFFGACSSGNEVPIPDYGKTGGTLVQELNIDEGDIIKTYDNIVYKLQSDGLVIYSLDDSMRNLAYYKFQTTRALPVELYATDNVILITYSIITQVYYPSMEDVFQEATLDVKSTYVIIFANPVKELSQNSQLEAVNLVDYRQTEFSIDGRLYDSRLMLDSQDAYFTFEYRPNNMSSEHDNEIGYSLNGERLYQSSPLVPGISNDEQEYAYDRFSYLQTLMVRFNLSDLTDFAMSGVSGAEYQDLYISDNSVIPIFTRYIRKTSGGCYQMPTYSIKNYVYKLNPKTLKVVDGVVLKDYALYDRRAIKDYGDTIYIVAQKTNGSGSTVIALDGKKFSLLNTLQKIAPDEEVKSVAFSEEGEKRYCYITTFLQIDPLFKVDITDPYKMVTLGFMEMPGYSTFMLPVGNRLITFGIHDGFFDENHRHYSNFTLKIALYSTEQEGLTTLDERLIEKTMFCEALYDPRVIAIKDNRFAFTAVDRLGFPCLYVFEIRNDLIEHVATIADYSLGANDQTTFRGGEQKLTDFGKYAVAIKRARFIDNYIYTFSDQLISRYALNVDDSGVTTIDYEAVESVFTSLGNRQLFNQ